MNHQKNALGLALAAELQERLERERRVADPGEAVVPVALAADPLGQRGGGRRRDRARRREDEQLQGQRAAHDGLTPRAGVAQAGPTTSRQNATVPSIRRSTSSRPGKTSGSPYAALATSVAREPGCDSKRPLMPVASHATRPASQAQAPRRCRRRWPRETASAARCACGRVRSRSAARRASAWIRARRGPRPVGPARGSGSRPERRQRHGIGDPDATGGGREGRLQHVGVRHVAPVRLRRCSGHSVETTATVGVEERAEDAGGVEIGQAPPVDRAGFWRPARPCGRRRSGHSRAGAGSVQGGRRLDTTPFDRRSCRRTSDRARKPRCRFGVAYRPPATRVMDWVALSSVGW